MNTVVIPGILSLETNLKSNNFNYFSLGEITNKQIFKPKNEKYSICVNLTKKPESYIDEDLVEYSSFYKVGKKSIYLERNYGGIKCNMLIKGMDTNNLQIYFNNSYYRLIRFKVDNLYPPGLHANDIIMTKMISAGDLVLHAASFIGLVDSKAFSVIAPPDTGKTFTAYKLLEKGYKFLGEDLSYYSHHDGSLKCMPYTSTWGHHFVKNRISINNIPFLQLFKNQQKETVDDIFGAESIGESGKLSRIYLLEKSSQDKLIKVEPSTEVIKKIISIQRNEFSYFKNPLIRAYEYFNDLDIESIYSKEIGSTVKLLNSTSVYLVSASKYDRFNALIHKNEQTLLNHDS